MPKFFVRLTDDQATRVLENPATCCQHCGRSNTPHAHVAVYRTIVLEDENRYVFCEICRIFYEDKVAGMAVLERG